MLKFKFLPQLAYKHGSFIIERCAFWDEPKIRCPDSPASVLCHDDFVEQQNYIMELEAKLAVYAHLAQAADDLKLGRIQNMDDAFDDILSELDGLEL